MSVDRKKVREEALEQLLSSNPSVMLDINTMLLSAIKGNNTKDALAAANLFVDINGLKTSKMDVEKGDKDVKTSAAARKKRLLELGIANGNVEHEEQDEDTRED